MPAPRIPRDWTGPLRQFQPTQLFVHPLDSAASAQVHPCPPCTADDQCQQGRCVAQRYLERARYASAAHRLVARKVQERRHRGVDRLLIGASAVGALLIVAGVI